MDRLREWFGAEEYESALARAHAFWDGDERFVVSVSSRRPGYRHCFDEARIPEPAARSLENRASLPGPNLPAFFADFGTVGTAKCCFARTHGFGSRPDRMAVPMGVVG